jgi:hypothetical protein
MPLYTYRCEAGHEKDEYVRHPDDKGTSTTLCRRCGGATMSSVITFGQGLCYFEEGRGRLIWNLGPEPILVKSHAEHKKLMRLNKVDFANRGTGYPGQWL